MHEQLPIHEIIPDVKRTLHERNIAIIQASPGAGKSTVLPLALMNEAWLGGKKILMLEPRRIAARSVANRMADIINEEIGNTIGYRIRFENKTNKNTRIEVLTEGILTRMLQSDNALENVGCVIFDEFHERSLHADLALALTREAQQVLRNDLRIIIMSATLDGEKLAALLGNAPIITSSGRQYPITHYYIDEKKQIPLAAQIADAIKIAIEKHDGDVLTFLPGAADIQKTNEILQQQYIDAIIYPLYGDLPMREQQLAIMPDKNGRRKIVLATSIAETSLTIQGVKIVIDSGYARIPQYDLRSGLTKLKTVRITKDTAEQRAGRAGRLGPGICYRLWNEALQHSLTKHRNPEIMDADLTPTVLELANWGKQNINDLCWLSPPPASSVSAAKSLLINLEAISAEWFITKKGREMLQLPTHPRMAHMILESKSANLTALAMDAIAVLDERSPLQKETSVNITLRIDALRKWRKKEFVNADKKILERIDRVADAWRKILKTTADNSSPIDEEAGKLIAWAYPERIAKRVGSSTKYRLSNGRFAKIAEHDALCSAEYLAVAEMDAGTNEGKIFLAAPIGKQDITHLAMEKQNISWDTQTGIIVAQKEISIGALVLNAEPIKNVTDDLILPVLRDVAINEWETIFEWTDAAKTLIARVNALNKWNSSLVFPPMNNDDLKSDLEKWLLPFLSGVRKRDDFKKLNLAEIFLSRLSWQEQKKLNELAPEKIEVPSGSFISIQYSQQGSPPILAVRLQELFGMMETPMINNGKTKLMIHLLSPAYRPVQVTQDLASFWKNTYQEVRKELKVRYPKHSWPEDPFTAKAVRGVIKKRH
jgi:ATP-dependent helicase HrpB